MNNDDKNESKLYQALELTHKIFENIKVKNYVYQNYELIWSIYSKVHTYYSIPYVLNGNIPDHDVHQSFIKSLSFYIKLIFKDLILLSYSIISIIYFMLRRNNKVAIWTGDFYNQDLKGDFRLGKLYLRLEEEKINHIDFVRDNTNGLKHALQNMFKRKKPVIYYSSIERVFTFYKRNKTSVYLNQPNQLHESILKGAIRVIANPSKIRIFKILFKILNVKVFLCWKYDDRGANLIHASKLLDIKTIGFMHGAGMLSYNPYEYIPQFNSSYKIGPDIEGVWSMWWKDYYEKNSNLYGKIEVSGSLRKFKNNAKDILFPVKINKILWISEPLVDVDEVIRYLDYLVDKFEVTIKKRPYTNDKFYNQLIKRYPKYKNVPTNDGDIYKAIEPFDLVVGSHSNAVIEASFLNKPFLLVNTNKWGNFFEIDDLYFAHNLADLSNKIKKFNKQKPLEIKSKYFGEDSNDGVQWLIDKINYL